MRQVLLLAVVSVLLAFASRSARGRLVDDPGFKALYDKADLVVIAAAREAKDLNERTTILEAPVVGVQTTFSVSLVLKGAIEGASFKLHHYRFDREQMAKDPPEKVQLYSYCPPSLAAFGRHREEAVHEEYLMFLKREGRDTFVPLAGQTDVFVSVQRLTLPPEHWPLDFERKRDVTVCRFRLEIASNEPDKVSSRLRDDVFGISGVVSVNQSGGGRKVSLYVHMRGRDLKDDERVLKQVVQRIEAVKEIRIVVSDFIRRRGGAGHEASPVER